MIGIPDFPDNASFGSVVVFVPSVLLFVFCKPVAPLPKSLFIDLPFGSLPVLLHADLPELKVKEITYYILALWSLEYICFKRK